DARVERGVGRAVRAHAGQAGAADAGDRAIRLDGGEDAGEHHRAIRLDGDGRDRGVRVRVEAVGVAVAADAGDVVAGDAAAAVRLQRGEVAAEQDPRVRLDDDDRDVGVGVRIEVLVERAIGIEPGDVVTREDAGALVRLHR